MALLPTTCATPSSSSLLAPLRVRSSFGDWMGSRGGQSRIERRLRWYWWGWGRRTRRLSFRRIVLRRDACEDGFFYFSLPRAFWVFLHLLLFSWCFLGFFRFLVFWICFSSSFSFTSCFVSSSSLSLRLVPSLPFI